MEIMSIQYKKLERDFSLVQKNKMEGDKKKYEN